MDLQLKGKICPCHRLQPWGLGFAVARTLASEGANVIINGRNSENLKAARQRIEQETDSKAAAIVGDLALPAMPATIVKQAAEIWEGLDILVTNAGGPPPGAFETLDDDAWDMSIQLSLMCHVRLIRAALPFLKESNAASVLAITSYSVKQPIPKLCALQQCPLSHHRTHQNSRPRNRRPGHPLQCHPPRLDEHRTRYRTSSSPRSCQQYHRAGRTGQTNAGQPSRTHGHPAGILPMLLSFSLLLLPSYITGTMLTVDGGMYKGTF